ncbi:hypothetical protein WKH24_00970 [Pantoea agglomerans]
MAAIELIKRDQASEESPVETLNLVGPDTLTGEEAAQPGNSFWAVR